MFKTAARAALDEIVAGVPVAAVAAVKVGLTAGADARRAARATRGAARTAGSARGLEISPE